MGIGLFQPLPSVHFFKTTTLGHNFSSQRLSMDNTTALQLCGLEISGAPQQETPCISDIAGVANLPDSVPSRELEPQNIEDAGENQDRHAQRIALPRQQETFLGIIGAHSRRPNDIQASSGENDQQRGSLSIQRNPQNCPAIEVIWRGKFEVPDCPYVYGICEGIIAHPSARISRIAYQHAGRMARNLCLVMYTKDQFWPDIFKNDHPNRDDIALYFYPENNERSKRQYSSLLKFISSRDMMLRSLTEGVELLVYPSKFLEVDSQKLGESFFMWGVFHRLKGDISTSNAGAQTSPTAAS